MEKNKDLGFVLIRKDDGTYIKIDDVKVSIDVIEEYIEIAGVRNYDRDSLRMAISNNKQTTLRFSRDVIEELDEKIKVNISGNKLEAYVKFYPPSEKGKYLTKSDIIEQLKGLNVVYGLKDDVIEEVSSNREYFREYFVAEGDDAVQGIQPYIDYKFDINAGKDRKPKIRLDGTVDYNSVEVINPVNAGELLAKIIPGQPGSAGKDISGEDIYPEDLEKISIITGNNVELSEDGSEAYALCDGQAAYRGGKIWVDNVYIVQGDVDVATGNIAFNGDVLINGSIRTGFSVRAKGNIEINGVVEGAEIKAGKSIMIRNGIQGMKKAYVVAGEDVTTKFIESAVVIANGFINASSILYSDITGDKGVLVKGEKAIIVGGITRALGHIECDKVGSIMGANTVLQVGYPEDFDDIIDELVSEISTTEEKKDDILQVIRYYKNNMKDKEVPNELVIKVKNIIEKSKEIVCELDQKKRTFNRYKNIRTREETDSDIIIVSGHVYQGVKVEINGASRYIRDEMLSSVFRKAEDNTIVANAQ